jgi:hypothetical protein
VKDRNRHLRADNSSGFTGVSLYRRRGKFFQSGKRFQAQISVEGKNRHLGYFDSRFAARDAYERACLELRCMKRKDESK